MRLTIEEEDALMQLIERMTREQFESHLFRACRVRADAFVGPNANIIAVSLECVAWLQTSVHQAPPLLSRLVEKYPDAPECAVLRTAAERLTRIKQQQDNLGPVDQQILAGGVPVVNRAVLRSHLAALRDGRNRSVVVVRGASGLGRTHSWNLIQHVAATMPKVKAHWIDLVGHVLSQQSLPHLFNYLVRILNLPDGDTVTTEGVTGATLSDRFIGEFLVRVQAKGPWAETQWLVFDHLDRNIAPEIKMFVMGLASLRLKSVFGGCVFFLLGPDATSKLDDPASLAPEETLVDFLDDEIEAAVRQLNSIGQTPLDGPALEAQITALKALRHDHHGRELASAVFGRLVSMRQMVGVA